MSSENSLEIRCDSPQTPSDQSPKKRIDALEDTVQTLCERVKEQSETIERQQEQLDKKQDQIDDLDTKLETETERRTSLEEELEAVTEECEWLKGVVFDLEEDLFGEYQSTLALSELEADSIAEYLVETQSNDSESADETNDDESNSILHNTLTKVLQWPRDVVERELTKNEALARKVAQRIPELAKRNGTGGYVITSRMIGDFFVSDRGQRPHTQTIARIIDFLVRFAGDHVSVGKKHGRKRLAFDEELVAALDHTRGDSGNLLEV